MTRWAYRQSLDARCEQKRSLLSLYSPLIFLGHKLFSMNILDDLAPRVQASRMTARAFSVNDHKIHSLNGTVENILGRFGAPLSKRYRIICE